MAVVRTVIRGERKYHYLVQTYRWGGHVRRKERYLGLALPADLNRQREALEREVWSETWFRNFQEIHGAHQARQRTLPRTVLLKEQSEFVIEFTYDTNRIEGSTLTFDETSDLLSRGVSPGSKPMADIRETQLHGALVDRLLVAPEPVDLAHLLRWHKAIFSETKPDIAGRLRDFEVRIGRSRHIPPPPLEVRPMLVELLRRLNRSTDSVNPVELAARFHLDFESVHPFGDGNGRIGRLAMNMILHRAGYPLLNIRCGKRRAYYHALERSNLKDDRRPFLMWFFRRYRSDNQFWIRKPS